MPAVEETWVLLFCLSSGISTDDQKTSEVNQLLQKCLGGNSLVIPIGIFWVRVNNTVFLYSTFIDKISITWWWSIQGQKTDLGLLCRLNERNSYTVLNVTLCLHITTFIVYKLVLHELYHLYGPYVSKIFPTFTVNRVQGAKVTCSISCI